MKVALVVNRIENCMEKNLKNIVFYINKAADEKTDLVLFSETALTGLINEDKPQYDIKLGVAIPGDVTDIISKAAEKRNINVAIGLFEREENFLYDSAIFVNRSGEIALKYRRISKGWHNPKMKDNIYREGDKIKTYKSDIGNVGFLICGDLFDDDLVDKAKLLNIDYLLFPFARSFYDGSIEQSRWNEELKYYIERVKRTNTITLGTNYLDKEYFGGAFIILGTGEVISTLEVGTEGMLIREF